MKKIIVILIAAVMICSCGNKNKNVNVDNQVDTTEVVDRVNVDDSL